MSRRKPRQLRPEEEQLWNRVAKTARPMDPKRVRKDEKPPLLSSAPEKTSNSQESFAIEPFDIGSKSNPYVAPEVRSPSATPVRMDLGAYRKLRRGRGRPEARIDLHGMTADAAYSALLTFLLRAHGSGKRLVLVITGKGRPGVDEGPIPTRPGILRRSLPEWTSRPPLSAIVLETTEAHQRHGGSGAFYVYLRRGR